MDQNNQEHRYQARILVRSAVIFTTLGDDLDELIALVNAKVESESSGTEGEIIDLSSQEIVYRCRKQAANE